MQRPTCLETLASPGTSPVCCLIGTAVSRYCATHQEMREAIARGLDGPGISPLDVHPQSWAHCPGFKEEMEHRRRKIEAIKVRRRCGGLDGSGKSCEVGEGVERGSLPCLEG